MKKNVFLPFVCMLLYVQSATTISEMVWLKDVTRSFKTEKMRHDDLDLPDKLTFHLTGRSYALTLNLKRNYGIDPNADVYFVRNLKDGQPHLDKGLSLEQENIAYYQDRKNGAFMTVRCVKRSNRQCERVINGNLRIGDKDYDLQLADVASRNEFDVPGLLGTRYVLRKQANIQTFVSTERKSDSININVKNVEQEFIDIPRRLRRKQEKQDHFRLTNSTISSRNVASFYNRGRTDKRNTDIYWIEVAVLLDTSIWDFFVSLIEAHMLHTNLVYEIDVVAARRIKEYFSHIINGVHLLYNQIEDSSIEISVTLRKFIIFKKENDIALLDSLITSYDGKTYVGANTYLNSINSFDATFGVNATHDHAMLFTRHVLSDDDDNDTSELNGRADHFGICVPGKRISVVGVNDYFETVHTATHELGHNLGLDHDSENTSIDCQAEDLFIMAPSLPLFDPNVPYSRNPWLFSNCSVRTLKTTLKLRECLKNSGIYFNMEEWKIFTAKLPGEAYNYNEQCELINGPNSIFCGVVAADICIYLWCSDPQTGHCDETPFSAARGTKCGRDKWCIEGLCVDRNKTQENVAVGHTQYSTPEQLLNL